MKYSNIIVGLGMMVAVGTAQAQSAGADSASASQSAAGAVAVSNSTPQGIGVGGTTQISFDNHSTNTGSDLSDMIPAVYTASLTNSVTDVCFGSGSGGVSGPGFGATFATTFVDQDCVARLDSRELASRAVQMNQAGATELGLILLTASFEIMCSRPQIFAAMTRVSKLAGNSSICAGQNPANDDYDALALRSDTELNNAVVSWKQSETGSVAMLDNTELYSNR